LGNALATKTVMPSRRKVIQEAYFDQGLAKRSIVSTP